MLCKHSIYHINTTQNEALKHLHCNHIVGRLLTLNDFDSLFSNIHEVHVISIYRKPVQLSRTGFLNLQNQKPVFRFKPVLYDTSNFYASVV